jgi:cobalt/nickel transport system permease protein
MHMADALLSPTVGVGFLAGSGGVLAYTAKRIRDEVDDSKIPLMGVLGAFVFAAQMINFAIPGTGSSGHIGGGMLLAMLLGPYAAFVTMASVLIVQALIFADGGILALGTNIWNLGVYPCLVGWWLYRVIVGRNPTYARLSIAAMIGIIMAIEMGALSVAIQTVLSGRSELPLGKFSILMLGIHLPIAVIEGFVTLGIVNFAYRIRPKVVEASLGIGQTFGQSRRSYKPLVGAALAATFLVGGVVSWFASARPDGLEWSILRLTGSKGIPEASNTLNSRLSRIQEKSALLPDYELPARGPGAKVPAVLEEDPSEVPPRPYPSPGRSVSGIVGSLIVLACVGFTALILVRLRSKGTLVTRGERPE